MAIPLLNNFEEILDDLVEQKNKLPKGKKFPVAEYLRTHGFLPDLVGINFSIEEAVAFAPGISRSKSMSTVTVVPRRTKIFTDLDFSGCQIINCIFDYCDLSGTKFNGINIVGSSFKQTVLNHCSISNTQFQPTTNGKPCSFTGASFDYSQVENTVFRDGDFSNCSFNNLAVLNKVIFENCILNHASIVGGPASQNLSIYTAPTEIALRANSYRITTLKDLSIDPKNPRVLIPWNNCTPGVTTALLDKMLMLRNLELIRMDYNPRVDIEKLDREINELNQLTATKMDKLRTKTLAAAQKQNSSSEGKEKITVEELWKNQGISFPMLMIKIMREKNAKDPQKYTQMTALYRQAKSMYDSVDGIIIPGGQDIDPRFYGAELDPHTILPKYNDDPRFTDSRRDALEFCLVYIQQRAAAPKPLCGICRGSQVIAASYGGKMCQNIADDKRWAYFIESLIPKEQIKESPESLDISVLSTHSRLIASSQDEDLNVLFIHHQAYNLDSAHGLVSTASTITESGIPIDLVAEHLQQNLTMTQAHPEFAFDYIDKPDNGISSRVSMRAADSIFGQFDMRVRAYHHSKQFRMEELREYPSRKMHSFFYHDTAAEPKLYEVPAPEHALSRHKK